MKKIYSVLILILTQSLFSQWTIQMTGINSPTNSNCIFFTNINSGYVATGPGGILYKTTNSGINWAQQIINSSVALSSVYFVDTNTGFITATSGNWFKTTNGGINWTNYNNAGYSGTLTDMFFINQNTGWCVGGNGSGSNFVSKTTNGGANWTVQRNFSEQNTSYSVLFLNIDTGFNNCGNKVWLTTNGGTNWNVADSLNNYICHFFFRGNVGYGVGVNGTIIKTTNTGFNWAIAYSPTATKTLWQSYFQDSNTGWICGDTGSIYYTTNGGTNYIQQTSGTTLALYSIYFFNQRGWCVGGIPNTNTGIILTTTLVGINQTGYEILKAFKLYNNYPNPFNPSTAIKFDIPKNSFISLNIYDITGKQVENLLNQNIEPGSYEIKWNADKFSSGIYFYELKTNDFVQVNKMILLK